MHDEPRSDAADAVAMDAPVPLDEKTYRERVEELFLRRMSSLMRFLRGKGALEHEAKDISQQAFLKLIELERPDTVRRLEPYLWMIAQNLFFDGRRSARCRADLDHALAEPEPEVAPPERSQIARQRVELVERALAGLPDKYRMAFELRVLDELSFDEAAQKMGIDISGVKRYVARVIAHIGELIRQAEGEQRGRT